MKLRFLGLALGVMVGLLGCESSTGPGSGAPVSLSLMVPVGGAAPAAALLADGELIVSDDLTITSVEVVLSEIEFERAGELAGCGAEEDEVEGSDDDSCEELTLGATTLDLDLSGNVATGFTVNVEPGTYEEMEFEIVGVNVGYTWQTVPGTFTTTVDAEIEQEFPAPGLMIEAGGDYNVTLSIDVLSWFIAGDGVTVIDPGTAEAGGANAQLVRNNIEDSFEGYEDDDHDGVPHDEDDDEDDDDF